MKQACLLLMFALMLWVRASDAFDFSFGEKVKEIPQWVSSPVADNAEYLHGVGEGRSLVKAEQSALNNISGKLATVVSSNVSSETTLRQGKVNAYFSEQVKSKTFDTKLSGYEIVQSATQGENYYVMVRMSRSVFVKDTVARLKLIDDRLNTRVALASKTSKVQHYLALNEIQPEIVEATALVLLLQAASPAFNSDKYLAAYQKYQAAMNEMLFQLRFRVEAAPDMSAVADIIIRLLGNEKLSASASRAGHADAVIAISGSAQNNIVFSEYSTQLRVNIQVTDETGRRINTEEIVVAGGSMSNFDASARTAANFLEKKLKDKGMFAMLGMQNPK